MMPLRTYWTAILLACLSALNTACTVPRAGALRTEIERPAASANVSVRPIDEAIVTADRRRVFAELPPELRLMAVMPSGQLVAGDRLRITILEGYSPTVPSAIGGRLELPRIDVGTDGSIAVPFAGRIPVAGLPIDRVRQMIEMRLQRKLFEPQVQVHLVESPDKSVSIVGAVRKGGSFQITPGMARLADLVGAAGVEADRPERVRIELRRGTMIYPLSLKTLLGNPADNVALRPGDVVSVQRETGFVTLMGAVTTPSRIAITGDGYSILDALSEARGLDARSADPSGIYLFPAIDKRDPDRAVEVYSIDIRNPEQVLLARQMQLVDGDLVYVSTAGFAQTVKVLDIISRTLMPLSRIPSL
jgi:polysaccharide export outer membrane protein